MQCQSNISQEFLENFESRSYGNGLDTRCLMVSIDQADPSYFYFRISWILMEPHWFHIFFVPFVFNPGAGPQKPPTLTASKIKDENRWPKI